MRCPRCNNFYKKGSTCAPCTQRAAMFAEVMLREATTPADVSYTLYLKEQKDADVRTESNHNRDS